MDLLDGFEHPRKRQDPVVRNTDRVQTGLRGIAAHLHDLRLTHHGIPIDPLRHDDEAIGHREDRIFANLSVWIFPEQERRGLPGGQFHREPLHELLHRHAAVRLGLWNERPKGVHDYNARRKFVHPGLDRRQDLTQIVRQGLIVQVRELHDIVHLRHVKERELLLVPQHLERRLTEDREVQGRTLRRRIREHELVGERRLAAPGFADDEIERVLGPAAAQDGIQLPHT